MLFESKQKSIKCLLDVDVVELTGEEIGKIKKDESDGMRRYSSDLPEYCLHTETGEIRTTVDYLQWTESGEENFLLFDAGTTDSLLNEEISNIGLEDLLQGFDLRPYLNLMTKIKYDEFIRRGFRESEYLIISLYYIRGDMYNPDWELDVNLDGVLVDLKVIEPELNPKEKV